MKILFRRVHVASPDKWCNDANCKPFPKHGSECSFKRFIRILDFRRVPPVAGRLVNITGEVLQVTHNEDLRAVFFTSPGEKGRFTRHKTGYASKWSHVFLIFTILSPPRQQTTRASSPSACTCARRSTRCAAALTCWRAPCLPTCPASAWRPASPSPTPGYAPTLSPEERSKGSSKKTTSK